MMRITITGTPGTGKTTLARNLKKQGFNVLDMKKIQKKAERGYDKIRKAKIISESRLRKEIRKGLKKERRKIIMESHLSHFASPKQVDLCIVLRCSPRALKSRLKKRGYKKEKIKENVLAEALDEILIEAEEMGHKIYEINTTGRKPKDTARIALEAIKKGLEKKGIVNWTNYIQKHKNKNK